MIGTLLTSLLHQNEALPMWLLVSMGLLILGIHFASLDRILGGEVMQRMLMISVFTGFKPDKKKLFEKASC